MTNSKKKIIKKFSLLVKEFSDKSNILLDEIKKEDKKNTDQNINEYKNDLLVKISKDYNIPLEELETKYNLDEKDELIIENNKKQNENICDFTVIIEDGIRYFVNTENSTVYKNNCNNKVGVWNNKNKKIILL